MFIDLSTEEMLCYCGACTPKPTPEHFVEMTYDELRLSVECETLCANCHAPIATAKSLDRLNRMITSSNTLARALNILPDAVDRSDVADRMLDDAEAHPDA